MKAFAEHQPDNPDNEPDSSIELVREPDVPEVSASSAQRSTRLMYFQHRDPLVGVLDYIAEVSYGILFFVGLLIKFFQRFPNEELAIAHEDDLKLIEGVVGGNMTPFVEMQYLTFSDRTC